MNKEFITEKEGIALIILYSIGTSSVIVTAVGAQNDLWISIILATLIMIPIGLVYSKLNTMFPNKDLFDILNLAWGKFWGKIILILYLWYLVNICIFVLKDLSEFFRLTVGPETPMTIPMMSGMIVAAIAIKKGIAVLGRMASFLLLPILILIALDNISLLPNVNIHNVQPVLYNGWGPVLKGVLNTISFPLGEIIAFIVIFQGLNNEKKAVQKTYIKGILATGIVLLISSSITILVIGPSVANTYYFPAYVATTRINVGNFMQSIEIILAFMFTIGGFTNFTVLLLCSTKGIGKFFGIDDYKSIVVPIGLFVLNLSLFMSKSTREFYRFTAEIWPYYAFPFQIVFPIITLILAKFKLRKKQTQKILE